MSAAEWLGAGDPVEEVELEPIPEPPMRRPPYPPELCFTNGTPNAYAIRAENRRRADGFFLVMFAQSKNHDYAAMRTCQEYDHEARAGRCDRCGLGVRGVR